MLAGAVKQVFRDLPEPIFPFHLYDALVQIARELLGVLCFAVACVA